MTAELIDIYDEKMNLLGTATREQAHREDYGTHPFTAGWSAFLRITALKCSCKSVAKLKTTLP